MLLSSIANEQFAQELTLVERFRVIFKFLFSS